MGGGTDPKEAEQTLEITPKFNAQLGNFVKVVKQIISTHGNPGDNILFQPARSKGHRLEKYGVDRHNPCISAQLMLMPCKAKLVHECLASIIACPNNSSLKDLHFGTVRTKAKNPNMRGPVPWSNVVLGVGSRTIEDLAHSRLQDAQEDPPVCITSKLPVFVVNCHICFCSLTVIHKRTVAHTLSPRCAS